MDWTVLAFGVLLGPPIVWGVVHAIVDAVHGLRARRDLPTAGAELGLAVRPTHRLPELHGRIDGFEVEVTSRNIEVKLRTSTPFWFSHHGMWMPPPWGWALEALGRVLSGKPEPNDLDFGDAELDAYFTERRSSESGVHVSNALREALRSFVRRHPRLVYLHLGDTIRVKPRLGSSGHYKTHAISGAQVRALVPDLIALARVLEAPDEPGRWTRGRLTDVSKRKKKPKRKRA
jgi:hypothetical protein